MSVLLYPSSPVAFVEFDNSESASRALDAYNGYLMKNKPLFVEFAKEKRPRNETSQPPPVNRDQVHSGEKRMRVDRGHITKPVTLEVIGVPGERTPTTH